MSQLEAPVSNNSQAPSLVTTGVMTESAIDELINPAMLAVNDKIQASLQSDVVLINQMGAYIIGAGGKRLRPKLVVLSALALGYQGSFHTNIAAVIEFIHTATLLHDDVVDSSSLRRGQQSANDVWGNEAAVLVGDFLYSRSFEMMVEVGQMRVMEILSAATNTIAAGEVMQLMNIGEPDTTEHRYMEVISAKTGKLFEAATRLGAVLANADKTIENSLAEYGAHLGIAFQLIDDVLDYTANANDLGKNAGDDLIEGKPTLPLIYALQTAESADAAVIRKALADAQQTGQLSDEVVQSVVRLVCKSDAIEKTVARAKQHVDIAVNAISCLPASAYKNALTAIATTSVQRRF